MRNSLVFVVSIQTIERWIGVGHLPLRFRGPVGGVNARRKQRSTLLDTFMSLRFVFCFEKYEELALAWGSFVDVGVTAPFAKEPAKWPWLSPTGCGDEAWPLQLQWLAPQHLRQQRPPASSPTVRRRHLVGLVLDLTRAEPAT